jgi:hypothetical protein
MIKIKGKVTFEDIEGGFWGIIGDNGSKWVPVPMPEQLKQDGARVQVNAEILKDTETVFMWGTPVRIKSYHTLPLLD